MPTASQTMSENASRDFADFYEEWFDRVYNYARHRTGSAVLADEIVSDTFARVLDSWSRFDPEQGDRRSWLFSIAFRSVADHYRSQERRRWFSLDLFFEPEDSGATPGREMEAFDEKQSLIAALGRLNEQQREIVSLKFFGGMTNRAIGKLLGLGESNVGVILFRAIRRMRTSDSGGEGGHE